MNSINISGLDSIFELFTSGYFAAQETMAGLIVMLVVGLVCCFLGYRLTRYVCAVLGAVIGGALCAFVAYSYLPINLEWIGVIIAGVLGAILVAYLFFYLYYVTIFLICAAVGAMIGSVPAMAAGLGTAQSGTTVFYIIVLACAVLFGAAGVLFLKPVVILLTSLGGFLAAPQILILLGVEHGTVLTLLTGAALTVLGFIVQVLTNRKRSRPGFRKLQDRPAKKGKDTEILEDYEAAEEDALEGTQRLRPEGTAGVNYEEIDETPEAKRTSADELGESMKKNGLLRFLMAVSPVLAIAAAVAVIAAGSVHFELVLVFAFLCYAGRHYKALMGTFLLLFGYSVYNLVPEVINWAGAAEVSAVAGLVFDAVACALFLLLFVIAVVMDYWAHPKKRVRRVPITEEPTVSMEADADDLEATRPLTEREAETVMNAGPQAGEETEEILTTRPLGEDDVKTFEPGAPAEFRQTQTQIFGAEPIAEDSDMGAEPDAADEEESTQALSEDNLSDTKIMP